MSEETWIDRIATVRQKMAKDDDESLADVLFRFPDAEKTVELKAHKLILALKSDVFKAMFYGGFVQNDDKESKIKVVEVLDVPANAFSLMLDYVYTDQVELNKDDVAEMWNVWAAANKYMIGGLLDKCKETLLVALDVHNVPLMLQLSSFYEEHAILYKTLRMLDQRAQDVLQTCDKTSLDKNVFIDILGRRTLKISECEVFKAAHAFFEAKKSTLDMSFEEFLPVIDFSHMNSEDFVHHVLTKNVLPNDLVTTESKRLRQREEAVGRLVSQKRKFEEDKRKLYDEVQEVKRRIQNDRDGYVYYHEFEPCFSSISCFAEFERQSSASDDSANSSDKIHRLDEAKIRLGPGTYQATRFVSKQPSLVLQDYPESHCVRFKVDKDIFLLGICVTERDSTLPVSKVNFSLELRNDKNERLSGSNVDSTNAMSKGAHEIWLKDVENGRAFVRKDQWYKLIIGIEKNDDSASDSSPLMLVRCKQEIENFGVKFVFEEESRLGNQDDQSAVNEKGENGKSKCNDDGLYSIVSRIYFYF